MCNLSQGIRNNERNNERENVVRRMIRRGTYSDEEISVVSDVDLSRVKEIRKEEKTREKEGTKVPVIA